MSAFEDDRLGRRCYLDRIADELNQVSFDLEQLGATLCTDDEIASRYGAQLQAIDWITQRQRCLAGILQADDIAQAARECPLEELARRIAS